MNQLKLFIVFILFTGILSAQNNFEDSLLNLANKADKSVKAKAFYDLANHFKQSDVRKSKNYISRAISNAKKIDSVKFQGELHYLSAELHIAQNNFQRAFNDYQIAYTNFVLANESSWAIRTRIRQIESLLSNENAVLAHEMAFNDDSNLVVITNEIDKACWEKTQATILIEIGEYEIAKVKLEGILRDFPSGNDSLKFIMMEQLAHVYMFQNHTDKAMQLFNSAYAYETNELKKGEILQRMANLYFMVNDIEKARNFYIKAIEKFDTTYRSENLGNTYLKLSEIYFSWNNFYKSKEYAEEALNIFIGLNQDLGIARTLYQLGNYYSSVHISDSAIISFETAYNYYRKNYHIFGMIQSLVSVGNIYADSDKWFTAIEYYEQANNIVEQTDDKKLHLLVYDKIGDANLNVQHPGKAINNYQNGIAIAEEINDLYYQYKLLDKLSQAYRNKGDYEAALNYFRKSASVKDSLFKLEKTREIAELQNKLNSENKSLEDKLLSKEFELSALKSKETNHTFVESRILILFVTVVFIILIVAITIFPRKQNKQAS